MGRCSGPEMSKGFSRLKTGQLAQPELLLQNVPWTFGRPSFNFVKFAWGAFIFTRFEELALWGGGTLFQVGDSLFKTF